MLLGYEKRRLSIVISAIESVKSGMKKLSFTGKKCSENAVYGALTVIFSGANSGGRSEMYILSELSFSRRFTGNHRQIEIPSGFEECGQKNDGIMP
jgi:hypothetical protein